MDKDFEYDDLLHDCFETIRPIVYKAMKRYIIFSWTRDDYIQEGYILLDEILKEHQDVPTDQLCTFFKVRYTQLLLSRIRRQTADKRGYDKLNHSDLTEVADLIADYNQNLSASVIWKSALIEFRLHAATPRDLELLDQLESGQRIKPHERRQLRQNLGRFLKIDNY
jgi:competence protein ComX